MKEARTILTSAVPVPTTQVLVQSVPRPPIKEADETRQHLKRKRLTEEAAHASSVAARELRAVVSLASRRGLNAEEIFQHFVADKAADARVGEENVGSRCAGRKDVVRGVEGLGISLSEEAAGLLIETIVRSSGESQGQYSTRTAAGAGQPRRNMNQPRRVPKGRGRAAFAASAENTKPGVGRQTSSERSSAGRKTLPPLLRQHITAADLWNFAASSPTQDGNAQSNSEDAETPIDRGEGPASADEESFHALSQEEAKEDAANHSKQSIQGEAGPLSIRKRARNMGSTRGGFSAKEDARNGTFLEEDPRGMDSTDARRSFPASTTASGGIGSIAANRAHQTDEMFNSPSFGNLQASSTMPSFPIAGGVAATAGAAASATPSGLEAFRNHVSRPHSMPTHFTSTDSRRKGDLMGSRRRRTFPTLGRSVAATPATVPSVSREQVEVASFPCENPTLEAADGKDRVFHVDRYDWKARITWSSLLG